MTPPTLPRQALMLLSASAIVLSVGAAVQARQMAERSAEQCEGEPTVVETVRPEVVSVPIPMPLVADPEPEIEIIEDGPEIDVTTALPAGSFAFVVDIGTPHLVLATEVPETWADSDPVLENPGRVTAKLRRDALPPDIQALIGKEFTLYDADGKRGSAWVGWPRIVSEAEGELGDGIDTFEAWQAFEDPTLRVDVEEDAELIEALWTQGRRLVVAPLDTDADGAWARLSSLPAPNVLTVQGLDPEMIEEEVPWAWQDPAVLDWSGGYEVYRTASGDERRADLSDVIGGERWADEQGNQMVTFVVSDPDGGFCEGYGGSLWGAVDRGADRKHPAMPGQGPAAVFDLDGDGVLDVLTHDDEVGGAQLLLGGDEGFAVGAALPTDVFFGCPC